MDSDLVLTWRLLRGVQKRMEWARWTVGEEDEDDEDDEDKEDEDSYSGDEGEWVDVDATPTLEKDELAYEGDENKDDGMGYGHSVGFKEKKAKAKQMTEEQKEELLKLARAVYREYERVVGLMRVWGEWVDEDDREERGEWMYRGMK